MILPNNFGRKITRVNHLTTALLLRELYDGPCTVEELREATGLKPATIRDLIKQLIKQRLVHIAGRVPNVRGEMRVLQFQWAPDKPHKSPPRKTTAQRSREARERRRRREMARMVAGDGSCGISTC